MMQQLLQSLPRCMALGSSGTLAGSSILRANAPSILLGCQQQPQDAISMPGSWVVPTVSLRGFAKKAKSAAEPSSKKKAAAPTEPKRPLTGWTKYIKHNFDNKKVELGPGAKFQDVTKKLAEVWKTMSTEDRVPYTLEYAKYKEVEKAEKAVIALKTLSGYRLFTEEMHPQVKASLQHITDGTLRNNTVMSTIGSMWKALPQSQRDKYNERVKELKQKL